MSGRWLKYGINRGGDRLRRRIGRYWVVVALFGEGYGEVLDAVFDAESLKEDDEVSEVLDEIVIAFVGLDVAQEYYVVGEIEHAFGLCQNDNCCGERRVVRG